MQDFFKTMLDYLEATQMKDNTFYKMLCDDMYIAIKSFEIDNGLMFASARHASQGRQQSYTPRFANEESLSELDLKQPKLKRYTLSQDDISPYSSVGQAKMMREVSVKTDTKPNTTIFSLDAQLSVETP
jgi:hypothetical protein